MEMLSVQSSNLKSVGYDDNQNLLYIEFKHGGKYKYLNVDKSVYDKLLVADSKGKFFDQNIKKAGYKYLKV